METFDYKGVGKGRDAKPIKEDKLGQIMINMWKDGSWDNF